jgi:hypothetical protein
MVPLSPQSLIISARTLALMGAQDDYTFGDEPLPGDVFLVAHPRTKTFIQAGVIASVEARGRYDDRTPYFDAYTMK